jgi:hypothetical protein
VASSFDILAAHTRVVVLQNRWQGCPTVGLPSSTGNCCCSGLHCRGYQQLLPIGGFDPAYFEGATAILAEACNISFPPCQPDEPIRLEAATPVPPVPGVG